MGPILGWKGSYVVSLVGAERAVSFDNGPDSSVAEDTYFGLLAASQGYSFSFIEGDMWEKSPFNLMDFLQQRKRWLQGILLVAHSPKIPWRYRILITMSVYSWVLAPFIVFGNIFQIFFPTDLPQVVQYSTAFISNVWMYQSIYGTFRSFDIKKVGLFKILFYLVIGILVSPIRIVVEILAVFWGITAPKHKFFIVKKDSTQAV